MIVNQVIPPPEKIVGEIICIVVKNYITLTYDLKINHIIYTTTMKKFLLLTLAIVAFVVNVDAQERRPYNYYRAGYWGNIEALGGVTFGGGSDVGFSTVHGGRLGHGVAMGLGLGFYVDVNSVCYTFNIPIFLETKYSPMKGGRSPFVSLRTGFSFTDNAIPGFYLSPALGIDLKRFSLFVRYGFNLYPMMVDVSIPDLDIETNTRAYLKSHALSIGFAVNF